MVDDISAANRADGADIIGQLHQCREDKCGTEEQKSASGQHHLEVYCSASRTVMHFIPVVISD